MTGNNWCLVIKGINGALLNVRYIIYGWRCDFNREIILFECLMPWPDVFNCERSPRPKEEISIVRLTIDTKRNL